MKCVPAPVPSFFRTIVVTLPARRTYSTPASAAPAVTARTLSDLRSRIGKCLFFGLNPAQIHEAGCILQPLARDWRELLAGGEGFLTGRERRGLFRHKVVWGEMVSIALRVGARLGIQSRAVLKWVPVGYVSSKYGELTLIFDLLSRTRWVLSYMQISPMAHLTLAGHVNNVVYNRYAESARINWAANYANHIDTKHKNEWSQLWTPRGDGLILRSIRTDFKFPMTYPDHVTVYHKLRDLAEPSHDSFTLDVLILSERCRRPAARCVEDIVLYDYRTAKKLELGARPFMLDAFRETFRLQEETARMNNETSRDLIVRVRELEMASWDRDGAEEGFGAARP